MSTQGNSIGRRSFLKGIVGVGATFGFSSLIRPETYVSTAAIIPSILQMRSEDLQELSIGENGDLISNIKITYGNGVLVDIDNKIGKGLVITCNHNIDEIGNYTSWYSPFFPDGYDLIGETLEVDQNSDLAAVVVYGNFERLNPFTVWRITDPQPSEKGSIIGLRGDYCNPYRHNFSFGAHPCDRSIETCINESSSQFSIDEDSIVKGDSGSLVIDRDGYGVGIINRVIYSGDGIPLFSAGVGSRSILDLVERVRIDYDAITGE